MQQQQQQQPQVPLQQQSTPELVRRSVSVDRSGVAKKAVFATQGSGAALTPGAVTSRQKLSGINPKAALKELNEDLNNLFQHHGPHPHPQSNVGSRQNLQSGLRKSLSRSSLIAEGIGGGGGNDGGKVDEDEVIDDIDVYHTVHGGRKNTLLASRRKEPFAKIVRRHPSERTSAEMDLLLMNTLEEHRSNSSSVMGSTTNFVDFPNAETVGSGGGGNSNYLVRGSRTRTISRESRLSCSVLSTFAPIHNHADASAYRELRSQGSVLLLLKALSHYQRFSFITRAHTHTRTHTGIHTSSTHTHAHTHGVCSHKE